MRLKTTLKLRLIIEHSILSPTRGPFIVSSPFSPNYTPATSPSPLPQGAHAFRLPLFYYYNFIAESLLSKEGLNYAVRPRYFSRRRPILTPQTPLKFPLLPPPASALSPLAPPTPSSLSPPPLPHPSSAQFLLSRRNNRPARIERMVVFKQPARAQIIINN